MASLKAKNERETEILGQIARVLSVAEKLMAVAMALMQAAETKEEVDQAAGAGENASLLKKIAILIKSPMRKLTPEEESYVARMELENLRAWPPGEERKAEAAAPPKKKKAFVPPPGGFPKNKKLTKAERRELQDKQRAANAAVKGCLSFDPKEAEEKAAAEAGWATFDDEPRSPRTFPAPSARTADRAYNGQTGEVVDGRWVPED